MVPMLGEARAVNLGVVYLPGGWPSHSTGPKLEAGILVGHMGHR